MSHEKQGRKTTQTPDEIEAEREGQKASRRRNRGSVEPANWLTADGDTLRRVIGALTQHGCAIQFGYNREGGAFRIYVIGDGNPYDEYLRPTEDLNAWLEGFVRDYGGVPAGE